MKKKQIIVGPSRSGTTLVAGILSGAGGNFGINHVEKWDRGSGAFEHPLAMQCSVYLQRSMRSTNISNRLSEYNKKKAIESLGCLLREVDFVKYPPNSSLFPVIAEMAGFQPSPILVIRSFVPYAVSIYRKEARDIDSSYRNYKRELLTGILAVKSYGGCAVHYNEILKGSGSWIGRVGNQTGLGELEIAKSAVNIMNSREPEPLGTNYDKEIIDLVGSILDDSVTPDFSEL